MKGDTRPIATAIILTIVTCGIYGLFWLYWISRDLRNYLGRTDVSPGTELLLCILCFPYAIYWVYKSTKLVQEAQKKVGIETTEDKTVLNIILAVFGLVIVSMAIIQDDLNAVWARTP